MYDDVDLAKPPTGGFRCFDCGGPASWHFCEACEDRRIKRDGKLWWAVIIEDLRAAGVPSKFRPFVPKSEVQEEALEESDLIFDEPIEQGAFLYE